MKTFTFSLLALLLAGTAASVWFAASRFDGLAEPSPAHAAPPRQSPPATPLPPGAGAPSPPFRGRAGAQEVVLSVAPWPPEPMKELAFTLDLPGWRGKEPPRISLGMEGMAMGRNEVLPALSADGRWRGTGTIVACRSGRRDWTARVVLPGAGEAPFPLELAR